MDNLPSVCIIGGGPTGLYLANILKNKNYHITLIEKKRWPIDKVCGQGIMPSGFERLENLGIEFTTKDSYSFSGIRYITEKYSLKGRFKKKAMGVERSVLSKKLLDKLKGNSNISLLENTTVTNIMNTSSDRVKVEIEEKSLEFSYVFCCDGMYSNSRELLGLTKLRPGVTRLGARVHYDISPWEDTVQVFWNKSFEAYVTPVSDSRIEIAYLWYESAFEKGPRLQERLLSHFPELSKKLDSEFMLGDFKAYGPFKQYSSKVVLERVFFLGDAYQFKDGITGEGVSLGFKAADIIGNHFENFGKGQSLHIYFLYLNYRFWIKLSLIMSRYPVLRDLIIRVSRFFPAIFNTCLNLNDYSFKFMRRFY